MLNMITVARMRRTTTATTTRRTTTTTVMTTTTTTVTITARSVGVGCTMRCTRPKKLPKESLVASEPRFAWVE